MHLQWLQNYLSNRKQYIQFDGGQKTNSKTVKCDVLHGSILGPLLFVLYINDLQFAFVDDTNLFYPDKNINTVFFKGYIPLVLTKLNINDREITKTESINFLVSS